MKTLRILKLMGIVLIGLVLSAQVEANERTHKRAAKKAITLTVDKPMIEFMAKVYSDSIDASDIVRMQKVLGKIDHITISFCDTDACDYVLKFRPLDEKGLEDWMFNEGYLKANADPDVASIEPWMLDEDYLE